MMFKQSTWALALGAGVLMSLVAGCGPQVVDSHVTLTEDVQEQVRLVTTSNARRDGLLTVAVTFQNMEDEKLTLRYKFDWYDEQGVKHYDPAASWQRKDVMPKEKFQLIDTAPNQKINNWEVYVKQWD